MQWHTSVIKALSLMRPEDWEFEASLSYEAGTYIRNRKVEKREVGGKWEKDWERERKRGEKEGKMEGREGRREEGEISLPSEKRSTGPWKKSWCRWKGWRGRDDPTIASQYKAEELRCRLPLTRVTEINETEYILRKQSMRLKRKYPCSFHPYFPFMLQIWNVLKERLEGEWMAFLQSILLHRAWQGLRENLIRYRFWEIEKLFSERVSPGKRCSLWSHCQLLTPSLKLLRSSNYKLEEDFSLLALLTLYQVIPYGGTVLSIQST